MARHDVMHVDVPRRTTSGHRAALAIAERHEPPDLRCDVLSRCSGLAIGADALCVAFRDRTVSRAHREIAATAVLPRLVACRAHGRKNLVAGPAAVVG